LRFRGSRIFRFDLLTGLEPHERSAELRLGSLDVECFPKDSWKAEEVILAIRGDDLGLHQDGNLSDGLVVQFAGNDEQDGPERAQGAV